MKLHRDAAQTITPQEMANWIAGLMRENCDAVGFIPEPTVRDRYVSPGNVVFQYSESGQKVGYLLYGPLHPAQPVTISQHCIEYDKRMRGYGQAAFDTLRQRAEKIGASSIRLRVADDLPAVMFWQSVGFSTVRVVPGGQARQRMIIEMVFLLSLPLLR